MITDLLTALAYCNKCFKTAIMQPRTSNWQLVVVYFNLFVCINIFMCDSYPKISMFYFVMQKPTNPPKPSIIRCHRCNKTTDTRDENSATYSRGEATVEILSISRDRGEFSFSLVQKSYLLSNTLQSGSITFICF